MSHPFLYNLFEFFSVKYRKYRKYQKYHDIFLYFDIFESIFSNPGFDVRRASCWLFTARCSMWPGNHLVPCVPELVGSCVPIRCLPDPKCLFYLSGLSLYLSVDHFLPCPSRWRVYSKKFLNTRLYQLNDLSNNNAIDIKVNTLL